MTEQPTDRPIPIPIPRPRTPATPLQLHAALITVAALFSANYIVSKLVMREMAPMTFAWLRVAGAAIVLGMLVPVRRKLGRKDVFRLIGLSLIGIVFNQTLFLGGLALTSAHIAAILITLTPVFALGAAILLKYEKATVWKLGGIALAMTGAILVISGEGEFDSLLGTVMIVANCLSYALYLVLSKPVVGRLSPLRVVRELFLYGVVLMFPIAAPSLWRERWSDIPRLAWLAMIFVIAGPTVLAYLLNLWALRHADSSLVAVYTYVQPVLATILAAIFLGEEIRSIVIVAGLLIFAGVWLSGRSAATGPVPD